MLATTRSWTKLTLWLGDGGSPEDYTQRMCGITTKEFTIEATASESETPDCDDPDAPAWVERVVKSLSAGFSGSGVMAEEVFSHYRDWMLSAEVRNARIVMELGTPGYFQTAFLLTSLGIPAGRDDGKIGTSLQLASSGAVTWVNGAP